MHVSQQRGRLKSCYSGLKGCNLKRYKRAQIILMSSSGKKSTEVANWVGLHRFTICRCISAFNEHGISGIEPLPRPGRPSKSNFSTKKELLRLLEHNPEDFGILKARWTLQDLAGVFSSQNGLSVSYVWVKEQLEKIGYSFKLSKLRSLSQDPEYFKKKRL